MLTMVKKELLRLGFDESEIDSGGLRVETTFTKKAMKAAQDGVLAERPPGLKKLHVATASVDVKTGALLGFYAGQDYLDSQLNWAALGGSPGSAFKPFALAAALKAGFSLKDTFDGNSPYTFENGSEVVNEGEGGGTNYGSAISLLQATEDSVNTAYSDLTEALPNGPEDILKTAISMGIPRKTPGLEANNAIALGSATISPITMANAYATIANGGVHHDMFMVKKVSRSSDGKVLYRAPKKHDRALPDDIDRDVSYALQQVVQNGTGQNARALGPAGRRQDRDGHQRRRRRLVVVVRRLHPAGLDRGDVRAWQGQRGAQRLPAQLLRRELPDLHLARGDERRARGHRHRETSRRPRSSTARPRRAATRRTPHRRRRPRRPKPHKGNKPPATPTQTPPTKTAQPPSGGPGPGGGRRQRRRRGRRSGQPLRPDGPHLHPMTSTGPTAPESGEVIAPTRVDPFARSMSEVVGGPFGRHARPHRWWVPVRVLLALFAVVFSLAVVQHQPCLKTHWAGDQARYGKACYSDIPYLYTGRGFAEGLWPYADTDRYQAMEYPVGISYLAWVAAKVTQIDPSGPPVLERHHQEPGSMWSLPGMTEEVNTYFLVTAIILGGFGLLATWFLAGVNPRRPWDALPFVLSPALLMTGLINWDLMAAALVAGALWASARGRPALTGVMVGLGTAAKLYPLFLLGPMLVIAWRRRQMGDFLTTAGAAAATWSVVNLPAWLGSPDRWRVFWKFNSDRGADLGSVWLALSHHGHVFTAQTINHWSWLLFGAVCVLVAVLGLRAPRTPRLAQLGFLVVAGFLLVNKVYSPQYVLWLLPLAVLARPRWRDLLIWQAGELIYLLAVWTYLGGSLEEAVGGGAPVYDMAIWLRVAAQLYLVAMVVRDVVRPEHDPVTEPEPELEPALS